MTTTPDASSQGQGAISALLLEERRFPPDESFRKQANVNDPGIYERARHDPEAFWAEQAKDLDWIEPYRWPVVRFWIGPLGSVESVISDKKVLVLTQYRSTFCGSDVDPVLRLKNKY